MKNRYVIAIAAVLALLFSLFLSRWLTWWMDSLFFLIATTGLAFIIDLSYKRNRIKTIATVAIVVLLLIALHGFSLFKHVSPPLTISINTKGVHFVSPYDHIPDPAKVGPGKEFDAYQKQMIIQENQRRNGGVVKSDMSGRVLVQPQQYISGSKHPDNEWQIDHICPKSFGGTNSYNNAQVLARSENLIKLDDATLCPR